MREAKQLSLLSLVSVVVFGVYITLIRHENEAFPENARQMVEF